jgi:diguanylate cyclase (GGDEF)-like protein/PAS domain S-box-containing protein
MDIGFFRDLLVNATVVLTASILLTFVYGAYQNRKAAVQIIIGLIAGTVGILVLMTTVHLDSGIVFDTRSILVSTMGMFFGWAPTLIASATIITARIIMGGDGVIMGVLVTAVSAAAGLLWRELRLKNKRLKNRFTGFEFYLMGVVTHVLMLLCALALNKDSILPVLKTISIPVLVIYPFFSLLICMVIWSRLRQIQADADLIQSEIRFRTLYEQSPMGVAFEDDNGVMHSNRMAESILGIPMEQIASTDWPRFFHPEELKEDFEAYDAYVKDRTGSFEMERQFTRPDGNKVWIHLTLAQLHMEDASAHSHMWLLQDISERKQKEAEVVYLTYHDVLTGMYNRTYMEKERLRLNTAEYLPLSVILGDVNGLKLVNDAFGHDEGDYLLTEVSQILRNCLREQDVIARIGGDEFLVLLPQTDDETVAQIVDTINKACASHDPRPGKELFDVSISLGYATKENTEEPLDTIIKTAERFMYRRKLIAHKHMYGSILTSIKETLYEKSDETREHGERMAILAKSLANALELNKEDTDALELASMLHDIGKVRVDLNILKKAGSLTGEEWEEIKKHPEAGYRIAQSVPNLNAISEIILYHHERWDGTGYPQGLSGDSIPLLARILALVDSYDTMREDRGYRKALDDAEAVREVLRSSGKQFDPELTRVFVQKVLKSVGEEADT